MREIKVNPKGGWATATRDDLQKATANILGSHQCMNPQPLYEKFTGLDIYLPDVMHLLTGDHTMEANTALMDLLINDNPDGLLSLIEKGKRSSKTTKKLDI